MPPELTAAMEATASAVFNAATTTLLPQGLSPSPQVFVFDRLGGDRLVGQVTCRPYRRGQDAAVAIAELGRIAAGVAFYAMFAVFPGLAALIALWGLWFDQAVAALLYWRDRRSAA